MFCLNIITFVSGITIYTCSVLTLISVFYFNHLYFTGLWMVHRSDNKRANHSSGNMTGSI